MWKFILLMPNVQFVLVFIVHKRSQKDHILC